MGVFYPDIHLWLVHSPTVDLQCKDNGEGKRVTSLPETADKPLCTEPRATRVDGVCAWGSSGHWSRRRSHTKRTCISQEDGNQYSDCVVSIFRLVISCGTGSGECHAESRTLCEGLATR